MAVSIVRRTIFVTALLWLGPATVGLSQYANITSESSAGWRAFATFLWGLDSIVIVLAAWIVARHRIWHTWWGRLRVAAYVTAFTYGGMLCSAAKDSSTTNPFRWPGTTIDDYARPALGLLKLLIFVWILMPVVALCPGTLAEKHVDLGRQKSVSIAALFAWTAVVAAIMIWIRFLTSEGAPETAYSDMSPTQAISRDFLYLPFEALLAFAVMLVILGWTGKWWLPVAAFVGVLLFVAFGESSTAWGIERLAGKEIDGIFRGPAVDRWSYITGRIALMWMAFGISALTGVSFRWYKTSCQTNKAAD